MQLFELAKTCLKRAQLSAQYRCQQESPEAASGEPLRISVPFKLTEDAPDINKKHMLVSFREIPGVKEMPAKLIIPEGNYMKNDLEELYWLQNLSEFIANIQNAALRRACRKMAKTGHTPEFSAHSEPLASFDYGAELKIHEGKLADIPFEAMLHEIDDIKKQTFDGWKPNLKNPKIVGKKFKSVEQAVEVMERLQLICEVNGHDHADMKRDFQLVESKDDAIRVVIPKRHLDLARQAEECIGL